MTATSCVRSRLHPTACPKNIPHCYDCGIESWNAGRKNRFARNDIGDRFAYTQMRGPEDLRPLGLPVG